nr:placenta-specific protein 1-like isoform X1 [Microcebus murinus]XP_012615276.1 placenta-specific protein 1-like isoform X1 [Microcebus murinus]
MLVACSDTWLHVKVRRTTQMHWLQPQQHELHLGSGCPVNTPEEDTFGFLYFLTSCDIRTYENPSSIFIESSVTFEPTDLDFIIHIPVACYFQRHFPMILVLKSRDNTHHEHTHHEHTRPVGQTWSLSHQVEDLGICPRVLYTNNFLLLGHKILYLLTKWRNSAINSG